LGKHSACIDCERERKRKAGELAKRTPFISDAEDAVTCVHCGLRFEPGFIRPQRNDQKQFPPMCHACFGNPGSGKLLVEVG